MFHTIGFAEVICISDSESDDEEFCHAKEIRGASTSFDVATGPSTGKGLPRPTRGKS